MNTAFSTGGIPIRLTQERWFHIVENHDDLAGHHRVDRMAKRTVSPELILELSELASDFLRLPTDSAKLDYDREADVLYISLGRPQEATESEMLENCVLVRFRGDQLVGVTILEASKR